jgi:hypothetical protein
VCVGVWGGGGRGAWQQARGERGSVDLYGCMVHNTARFDLFVNGMPCDTATSTTAECKHPTMA